MACPDELPGLKPEVGEFYFGSGCEWSHNGATDCIEVLAVYDHDYMGWHALVQHWDYRDNAPDTLGENQWNYGLYLCCRENGWETRKLVWDFAGRRPSFTWAGQIVDRYLTCPEWLRFMCR